MSQQRQDPELKAMRQIKDALEPLTPKARERVIRFVADRINDMDPQPLLPGVSPAPARQ